MTIVASGFPLKIATAMFLTATNGDVSATNGVTLGGATITNNAPWHGQWTALTASPNGPCKVRVPAASAAVVRLKPR